jgi:hypothetical protein
MPEIQVKTRSVAVAVTARLFHASEAFMGKVLKGLAIFSSSKKYS